MWGNLINLAIQRDMAFRTSDSTSEKQDWEIPAVIATVRWNDPDAKKRKLARSFVIAGFA